MKALRSALGFTKIELIVVTCIMGIIASMGVPAVSSIIPSYHLRSAARDLFSNMQLTKMTAIRFNKKCRITYSSNPDQYAIDCLSKTIILSEYGSGIRFQGPAGQTFARKTITFNGYGTGNAGYAYLSDDDNRAYYRVGPTSFGALKMQKWDGKTWN